MLRKIIFSISIVILFGLSACGNDNPTTTDPCNDLAAGNCNKWDQMQWDNGKWAN